MSNICSLTADQALYLYSVCSYML